MAERRMFAKTIIDSDDFLEMPLSAQALYFHLGMRADDDGFLNNARKILCIIRASDDDLKILIAKRFLIIFDGGVVVIKHWLMHNLIRGDRYKETVYTEEKAMLILKENKAYTLPERNGLPLGNQMTPRLTQVRLGKDSIGKDREEADKPHGFIKPNIEQIRLYCEERENTINPEAFFDFYESKGWMVGRNKMKDWQAAVRTWEKTSCKAQQRPMVKPAEVSASTIDPFMAELAKRHSDELEGRC